MICIFIGLTAANPDGSFHGVAEHVILDLKSVNGIENGNISYTLPEGEKILLSFEGNETDFKVSGYIETTPAPVQVIEI